MPALSIDNLNARRAAKPASGGKSYTAGRIVSQVDLRARCDGMNALDLALEQIDAIFTDFRAFLRESDNRLQCLAAGMTAETEILF